MCGPQKGYGEKRCERPRNGCDGRLMVKILITTIQVNFCAASQNLPKLSLLKFLPLTYHHSHFLAATLDFTSFFTIAFLRAAHFLQLGCFGLDSNIPDKGPSLFPSLPTFEITEQGVYNLLSTCDTSKSPGPDSLHPYVLKATAAELSPILTHIFKQSLESGEVPLQWKHAYVTPIFKKGSKAHPGNYRPISLTSVVCKTMEHIIVSQIMKHLEDHNILSDNQFGFRSKHSCETQLLITVNDIAKDIDRNLQVDAAILDFSKAFDRVAHSRLLYKLNYYGIRGTVLQWLESFLHGRTQQVV